MWFTWRRRAELSMDFPGAKIMSWEILCRYSWTTKGTVDIRDDEVLVVTYAGYSMMDMD